MEWKPWCVVDIDVAQPLPTLPCRDADGGRWGGAWVLLRVFEEPVGSIKLAFRDRDVDPDAIVGSIPDDVAARVRDRLRSVAHERDSRDLGTTGHSPVRDPAHLVRRQEALQSGPWITAVICTRDQPKGLARCLASLQRQSYPRTHLLIVDNASSTSAARAIADESSGPFRVTYAFEARPGLSHARNRSLEEVQTDLIAWIDDDEVADPHWLCGLVGGFLEQPPATAVCGVMVPAELQTLPQLWFEEYGGHSKGRGFEPVVFSPDSRDRYTPLFPLPPFGTGGNMAMRTSDMKGIGGFDTALGAGTATFGAEDTRALSEILLAGGTVVYWPTAVTRHFHRRDYEGFRRQLYGYGAGLTAFYTSLVWDRPRLVMPLVRLAPHALRELRNPNGARLGSITETFPVEVLRTHRRGMRRGPLEYVRARLRS